MVHIYTLRRGLSFSTLTLQRPQEEYGEAIPLFERALSIRTKKLGANHPYTVGTKNYLESVRRKVRVQLGCRGRQVSPTTHRAKTCHCILKLFVLHLRCEDETGAACHSVTAHAMTKEENRSHTASSVTGRCKCCSCPRCLWWRANLAFLGVGLNDPSMLLF